MVETVAGWIKQGYKDMMTAARMERAKPVDKEQLREHLVNVLYIAATLGIIVVSLAIATIAIELNMMRIAYSQGLEDVKHGIFSRMDSFLWKSDTFLTTFSATNKSLARGLTEVRVQVKQSADSAEKNTKDLNRATTTAVTKAVAATNEVVQAVVDKSPSIVEVKSAPPTVEVRTPAPVRVVEPAPVKPPVVETPEETKKRRWYQKILPFLK